MTDLGVHVAPEPTRPLWATWLAEHPQVVLSVVLVTLFLVTAVIEPRYLSVSGLRNTVLLAAPLGIMAGAQTILMLTGGIDLSVGMIATAAAYVAANQSPNGAGIAIVVGLLVGIAAGAINGIGVGIFRVNPLIMTLAMSAILVGLFTALSFTVLQGSTTVADFISTVGRGSFWGNRIPYNAIVWAGVSVLIIYILKRTGFGRLLYAVGDNPVAVRLSGVRIWQVHIAAYAFAGLLAALAGIILAGRTGAVDLQLAVSFLLPSVAASVIGGTSIFGGVGTYTGTILGALILGVLATMLTFLDAGQAIQQIVYGMIVLALAWIYARVSGTD
ncbi:MAG TPA: ABC transporter permease [Acidimicrobiia bacterium]|nr:ABC transporter permease [Acidimicrobiia bacterium]